MRVLIGSTESTEPTESTASAGVRFLPPRWFYLGTTLGALSGWLSGWLVPLPLPVGGPTFRRLSGATLVLGTPGHGALGTPGHGAGRDRRGTVARRWWCGVPTASAATPCPSPPH